MKDISSVTKGIISAFLSWFSETLLSHFPHFYDYFITRVGITASSHSPGLCFVFLIFKCVVKKTTLL